MDADQRMHRAWRGDRVVGRRHTLAQIAAAIVGAVVLDLEAGDAVVEPLRQRLVDAIHRAERGVAPDRRHFERIQYARLRRHVEIRHVGVPHRFAVAEATDRFAVHFDVGYDVNLRQALDEPAACFLNGRPVEIPQAAAEGDQLLVTEALVQGLHRQGNHHQRPHVAGQRGQGGGHAGVGPPASSCRPERSQHQEEEQ